MKKWLDVPEKELKEVLATYIKDEGQALLAFTEIESVAHVTYEKEPEKE